MARLGRRQGLTEDPSVAGGGGGGRPARPPPLASIRLNLDTLKPRPVPDDQRQEFYDVMLADVERLERDLKAQGTPTEVFVYEGAAHAFYDFTRPRFHPEAARLAHARMIQFLQKHLR